ncbi:hypothetical protein [Pelagibacterium lentulum]|uniref:Uncharacterized protein n=1 Tax=Pelagibacterium lentulum TaxID=2029865 RepID=A0A916VYU6_9HYPH|nr:hypothetical protein [Pelagibacterium lentulum]GGA53065.1 hypothetical protein GCM10011499_23990 [Pelagibacterium lentulum]
MNSLGSRLRAIGITVGFFAASAFVLLGTIWALAALPFTIPGLAELASYRPHDSIGAVSDFRIIAVLSAAYLAAMALVVLIDMPYCDKMLAIFADVLLMAVAAIWGFIFGYWLLLRLAGYENFLDLNYILASLIAPFVVFVASLVPLPRLRHPFILRLLVALVLLAGAPFLLLHLGS